MLIIKGFYEHGIGENYFPISALHLKVSFSFPSMKSLRKSSLLPSTV